MTSACSIAVAPLVRAGHVLALAVGLVVASLPAPAAAATITVDTFAQFDAAKCTLTNAINSANDDVNVGGCSRVGGIGADTIVLPFGTYALTVPDNGTDADFTGVPVVTTDITIRGNGSTIIRTNGIAPPFFRIFSVTAGTLTLVELTVSGGRIAGPAPPDAFVSGGGINVSETGSLVLDTVTVRDNHLGPALLLAGGGGVGTQGGRTITMTDSALIDNSVAVQSDTRTLTGSFGGGLFVAPDLTEGTDALGPNVTITRSRILNNSATGGFGSGGGVAAMLSPLTFTFVTVSGNTVDLQGGGLFVSTPKTGMTVISDCTFTDNAAGGDSINAFGGALAINPDGQTLVQRSAFARNTTRAAGDGGPTGSAGLAAGGAILTAANLTVFDVTFVGNSATWRDTPNGKVGHAWGGAVAMIGTPTLAMGNVTMTDNSVDAAAVGEPLGGGIFASSAVTLRNSIVIGNSAPANCSVKQSGSFTSLGNNINPASGSCGTPVASDLPNANPQLGALVDLGRPAGQYRPLLPGSPAIDAGNPIFCSLTDQLGQARPGACDIGAVERVSAATTFAAILPSTRAGQLGTKLTAFVTVLNPGATTAFKVGLALQTSVPALFAYQTTNVLNVPVGSPNTPVDIPANSSQTFVVSVLPTAPFPPTELILGFIATNSSAPSVVGLNSLLVSASATPIPDVVALVATIHNDGIVDIPSGTNTGVFSLATVNLGSSDTITVSTDTGGAVVPLTTLVCQTNSAGACLQLPTPTVTVPIATGATPTFGFFPKSTGPIPFDPAGTRLFIRLKDSTGAIRGGSSVAPRTGP